MKKLILVVLLILGVFVSKTSFAQKGFSWDRVVFGGNFGMSFSTFENLVAASPSVGYRFTEKLTLGTGFIYQYYGVKYPNFKFNFNNYGARFYGTYQITDFLIAHTEYESLNLEYINFNALGNPDGSVRRNVGSWFVGGGYRQFISRNATLDLMLLYNLTETPYTPYANPIIRVGFGIGL
jgi:hypothetical protein